MTTERKTELGKTLQRHADSSRELASFCTAADASRYRTLAVAYETSAALADAALAELERTGAGELKALTERWQADLDQAHRERDEAVGRLSAHMGADIQRFEQLLEIVDKLGQAVRDARRERDEARAVLSFANDQIVKLTKLRDKLAADAGRLCQANTELGAELVEAMAARDDLAKRVAHAEHERDELAIALREVGKMQFMRELGQAHGVRAMPSGAGDLLALLLDGCSLAEAAEHCKLPLGEANARAFDGFMVLAGSIDVPLGGPASRTLLDVVREAGRYRAEVVRTSLELQHLLLGGEEKAVEAYRKTLVLAGLSPDKAPAASSTSRCS